MPSEFPSHFRISMQILTDELTPLIPEMKFRKGTDENILEGIRIFSGRERTESRYLWLVRNVALEELPVPENHCSLIVFGTAPENWIAAGHSFLELPENQDVLDVVNRCQDVFEKNRMWVDSLRDIMIRGGSVDELLRASLSYFNNPMFVHDAQLYLVSCPVRRPEMIRWAEDAATGLILTPLESVNEFRTDEEYRATLRTHGAKIFSASLRGYRDIYVNLWDDYDRYEGRLIICELDHPLQPGQFAAAEYLAELVKNAMSRRNQKDHTYNQAMENLLAGLIRGESYREEEVKARIASYGWETTDPYVCVRLATGWKDDDVESGISMCNHIDAQVTGSKAFQLDQGICVVINRRMNSHFREDIAYFLRESLMKGGISQEFRNLTRLAAYSRQARIALEYCLKNNDTRWVLSFRDVALAYLTDCLRREVEPSEVCDEILPRLQEYDRENGAELYKTLKLYVENERNTVKTAADLYIGRSTLFYRLRKIREVSGLDPEMIGDAERNLYLRLSFHLLEHVQKNKE